MSEFFLFNILRMDGQNLTNFFIPIIIDKIYVAIVKRHFSQICNRVSALDWCQKLVFAQYLENGCTELDQILYTLYHWQDLCLYCKGAFFTNLQQSYSPWLMSEIVFCSISWEFNQILNTHYRGQGLGWYCKLSFSQFAIETRPLIDIRNWFLLNILRMDGQNSTKFCIYVTIDMIYPLSVLQTELCSWIYLCPLLVLCWGYGQILWQF